MKKLIIILIFFSFFSCNKEEFNELIDLPNLERYIQVFENSPNLIFTDEFNDTIVFQSTYEKRIIEQELPDKSTYTIEDYFIQLNSVGKNIEIVLLGSAFVSSDLNTINPSLNIKLMPFQTSSLWMDINPRDNTLFSTNETDFQLTQKLLNEEFIDVYSVKNEEQESFSALYFNKYKGIIAFTDVENKLWKLSHME